jgi:hypothetical protein
MPAGGHADAARAEDDVIAARAGADVALMAIGIVLARAVVVRANITEKVGAEPLALRIALLEGVEAGTPQSRRPTSHGDIADLSLRRAGLEARARPGPGLRVDDDDALLVLAAVGVRAALTGLRVELEVPMVGFVLVDGVLRDRDRLPRILLLVMVTESDVGLLICGLSALLALPTGLVPPLGRHLAQSQTGEPGQQPQHPAPRGGSTECANYAIKPGIIHGRCAPSLM